MKKNLTTTTGKELLHALNQPNCSHVIPTVQCIVLCILTSVNVPTVLCQDCSTLVKRLTQNQNIVALSWPARSPDRVLIEHAWDILGRNVRCPHDGRTRPQLITGCVVNGQRSPRMTSESLG